jgi:hypothetical protein
VTIGTGIEEHQVGTGILKSRLMTGDSYDVEYEFTFRFGLQQIPTAPHIQTKQAHIVHFIRSVDVRAIPDGEYDLSRTVEGAQEYSHLRKRRDVWEIHPY